MKYIVFRANNDGSNITQLGPYDAATVCYCLDNEVDLRHHNFSVVVDYTHCFSSEDGDKNWKFTKDEE